MLKSSVWPTTDYSVRGASIGLYGIAGFYAGRQSKQGLLFGYGETPVKAIDASLTTLRALLEK